MGRGSTVLTFERARRLEGFRVSGLGIPNHTWEVPLPAEATEEKEKLSQEAMVSLCASSGFAVLRVSCTRLPSRALLLSSFQEIRALVKPGNKICAQPLECPTPVLAWGVGVGAGCGGVGGFIGLGYRA